MTGSALNLKFFAESLALHIALIAPKRAGQKWPGRIRTCNQTLCMCEHVWNPFQPVSASKHMREVMIVNTILRVRRLSRHWGMLPSDAPL